MMTKQEFLYYHDLSPHLRRYSRPTQRPVPIWPDSSTAGALQRNRRGRGLKPCSGLNFRAFLAAN